MHFTQLWSASTSTLVVVPFLWLCCFYGRGSVPDKNQDSGQKPDKTSHLIWSGKLMETVWWFGEVHIYCLGYPQDFLLKSLIFIILRRIVSNFFYFSLFIFKIPHWNHITNIAVKSKFLNLQMLQMLFVTSCEFHFVCVELIISECLNISKTASRLFNLQAHFYVRCHFIRLSGYSKPPFRECKIIFQSRNFKINVYYGNII